MCHFEINGNLKYESDLDFPIFIDVVCAVRNWFIEAFGEKIMSTYDLFVDNATTGSGYTPITIPVLDKYIIIKLNIGKQNFPDTIAFQFGHELMHYVFYVRKGIGKELADEKEEAICTAVSLIVIKKFYPHVFETYNAYVRTLPREGYRNGVDIARIIDYDIEKIKELI